MESGEKMGTDPAARGLAVDDEPDRGKRFYQRGSFWLGPFMWALGLFLAVLIGVGWYILGGFPGDHDEYATVNVPGQEVVNLPAGDVRLNHENNAHTSGDSTILDDQPDGLEVRVTPAGGGEPLEIEEVPSWLFSSTVNDRGHEPYRKVEIPSDGDYLIQATAAGQPPLGSPALAQAPKADDAGPEIAVGKGPWTPFDSKLAGAILAGAAIMLVMLAFTLPFRRFVR